MASRVYLEAKLEVRHVTAKLLCGPCVCYSGPLSLGWHKALFVSTRGPKFAR